ncbi:MAG: tetratricopeptide repeat protein [Verrucomicrobia bacterium]|nr:tetratricopeptide repeat protein [Verrucomicrobiota bacterium]
MHNLLYLLIVLFTLTLATPAEAQFWPFRTRASTAPADEQTMLAQPIFEQANFARSNGNLRSALRQYRRVYERYPISAFAPLALLYTGEIQMERRRWDKSVQAFQTLLFRHPDFPRFNEILDRQFEMAVALAEGDGMRFRRHYSLPCLQSFRGPFLRIIVRNAPFSDIAPFALLNVARIHQQRGNIEEAIDALDRLINNYPNSILVEQAYLELAKTFANLVTGPRYDQGSTREAISYFQDFLILFPDHEQVELAEQGLQNNLDVLAGSKLLIGEFLFSPQE